MIKFSTSNDAGQANQEIDSPCDPDKALIIYLINMLLNGPQQPASKARLTYTITMCLYGLKKCHTKDHRFGDNFLFMLPSQIKAL